MKVSVIITTYNQADTIERAINSVLFQQFEDFEIIIINDGSTDRTKRISNQYQCQLNTTVFNLHKVGMMKAYYLGFESCKGDYICLCDGDDYWTDIYKLQKQFDYMEVNQDCGLCITKVHTKSGDVNYPMTVDVDHINKNMSFDSLLLGNAYIHAQSYMIRKSVFDKYIDFRKFLHFYTWDYPIVLELIRHTRFHCLNFHSAIFVKSFESVTQTRSRIKRLKRVYGQYRIKLYFILKYGCKPTTILRLIYLAIRAIYSIIFKRW
jgi:glycosyltransferase involved in cell wall biosynthesis